MKIKLIILLILLFYIWTATKGTMDFSSNYHVESCSYNDLTDALINSQLHLLIHPDPRLLELTDPYENSANWPYRKHDASLYKGKYYLYYGITPAIVLFLPFRYLTQTQLPDHFAVVIFSFGGFLFAIAILNYLKNKYFNKIPNWMFVFSVIVLGLANVVPYILRRPDIYEVAISSGIFFLIGAIYWFCKSISTARLKYLILGSLFLGLAVGCRPQIMLAGIIIPVILASIKKNTPDLTKSSLIKICCAVVIPFLISILLIGLYNYLRFDNPFEFGHSYQLTIYNPKKIHELTFNDRLNYLSTNIHVYLFHLPKFTNYFPFVDFAPLPGYIKPPGFYLFEQHVGIFLLIPFILLIFIAPFLYCLGNKMNYKKFFENKTVFNFPELWIIIIPAILNLSILTTYFGVTLRYLADFATQLILVSCIIWFYFYETLSNPRILTKIAVTLGIISILNGLAFSIIGCYGGLKSQNQELYKNIESCFTPISNILSQLLKP